LCLYSAFGHLINDYADRDTDRAAGKSNGLLTWSEGSALMAAAMPGLAVVGVALVCLPVSPLVLTVAAVVLAAAYSLRPARLKERGILGWIAATLAQRTLPLAIVFEARNAWDIAALAFTVLNTVIGLRFIILHQLLDRDHDQRSGVHTVATNEEPQRLVAWVHKIFLVEVAVACVTLAAMSHVALGVGTAALGYATSLGRLPLSRVSRRMFYDTFSPISYYALQDFYCIVWPITLAVLLTARNPVFLPVVFVAVGLVRRPLQTKFAAALAALMGWPADAESTVETPRTAIGASGEAVAGGPAASGVPDTTGANGSPTVSPTMSGGRKVPVGHMRLDKADPYELYAQLRSTGPVLRLDWPGLGPTWLAVRHREAIAVCNDPRFVGVEPDRPNVTRATVPGQDSARDLGADVTMPTHRQRLRKLVDDAFTCRVAQNIEARATQVANNILDSAMRRGGIELISEYASVVPVAIMAEFLDVPVGDLGKFRAFIHFLADGQSLGRRDGTFDGARANFTKLVHGVISARGRTPRDDLVTDLSRRQQEIDGSSTDELITLLYLLVPGGFISTVNVIGNGMLALLRHPEQLKMLREKPALAERAIEELLRFDSPLELSAVSFASTDIELSGVRIPKDAPVRIVIPSANRDEVQFHAADTLDIGRDPGPHLSCGQGLHGSLEAPLVRLVGRIAVNVLVQRAPDLRLGDAGHIKWAFHPVFRGLQQLPLRF
jgi:cytochrome P450/4-hydroxybenzoate polyprenyltransferase